jgi:hypothetical protein
MQRLFIFFIVISLFYSCKTRKEIPPAAVVNHADIIHFRPDSPMVIYKTRSDYSQFVPVRMNAGRTEIIEVPHPSDFIYRGRLAFPVALNQGYWIDNQGITPDVAYLRFTIENYSKLDEPLSVEIMSRYILDAYPLLEMYQCGYRNEYRDIFREVNVLVARGLTNCMKIEVPLMPVPPEVPRNERK